MNPNIILLLAGVIISTNIYCSDEKTDEAIQALPAELRGPILSMKSEYQLMKNHYESMQIKQNQMEYNEFQCASTKMRGVPNTVYNVYVKPYIRLAFDDCYKKLDELNGRRITRSNKEFRLWLKNRYDVSKAKNDPDISEVIYRICPSEKQDKAFFNQMEYSDYFENYKSTNVKRIKELIPNFLDGKKLSALLPAIYHKMCIYKHDNNCAVSEALRQYEAGNVSTIGEALLQYNHWRIQPEDIRLLNILLEWVGRNFRFEFNVIDKENNIVLPTMSMIYC